VILPRQNEKNVNEDLTDELRRDMTIHFVSTVEEVLLLALTPVVKTKGIGRSGECSRRCNSGLRSTPSGFS
jgi:predicted ATP-dependent protease